MRALFITDSQIRGRNPINRSGIFVDDIYDKFKEVVKIGKEMEVDCFIHGGDFFDRPIVSLGVADRFVDLMEKTEKPWWIVRGNHDEIGHNPQLSGESMLDHLFRRSNLVKHLGGIAMDDGKVFLEGFDYYHDIEKDLKEKGLKSSMPHLEGKQIAVVHALITPNPLHPQIMHALCDEIQTDFDLVLCGHFHYEFGIYKVPEQGVTYVGIGALARMSIAKWDAVRRPNVLYIDTDVPTMKIIPLESAKEASELFNLEKLSEEVEVNARIDQFVASLESTKFQGLNLRGIIENIAKQGSVDRKVVDEVIKRIGEFEEE